MESLARRTRGEVLVAFDGISSMGMTATLGQKHGLQTIRTIPQLGMAVMRPQGPVTVAMTLLRAEPGVRWVEPNAVNRLPREEAVRVPGVPGLLGPGMRAVDPMRDQQWGLEKAHVPAAWTISRGRRETVVAIVDTGIDHTHPERADHVIKGPDLVNRDDDPQDDHVHGTHVAGIVGASADNGLGMAGVAPGVSLMAVKVMDAQGAGDVATICEGIVWAADPGDHVINLSIGSRNGYDAKKAATDYARSKGAVVVAAMGNDGQFSAFYPAACKGVVAVGATTQDDSRASFSNMGVWMAVTAPGDHILSTIRDGRYWTLSGTSMATPHVAALAALIRSVRPDLGVDQVAERIRAGARDLGAPGFDPEFGQGCIDAERTLRGL